MQSFVLVKNYAQRMSAKRVMEEEDFDEWDEESYAPQFSSFSGYTLFSKLPAKESWVRHGVVERQTVAADISWNPRLMVLTNSDIYFARPETNIVVDRIPIKEVVFIGEVDQGKLPEPKERKSKNVRAVVKFSSAELQDGIKDTFAFEVKTSASGRERSYFSRVSTSDQREEWVKDIKAACAKSNVERSGEISALASAQRKLRSVMNSRAVRSTIAFAILCDFMNNIAMSEFLFSPGSGASRLCNAVDRVLDFFFGVELLLVGAANWRTWWGAPFFLSAWNLYHLATVVFQVCASAALRTTPSPTRAPSGARALAFAAISRPRAHRARPPRRAGIPVRLCRPPGRTTACRLVAATSV